MVQNGTGISNSEITVANSSDLSGPIAGLFVSAQQAVNKSATDTRSNLSGVNLDEEAASLLQWQQAYQAAAQALTVGNSLFTTLIDSVNGTFT